MSRKKKINRELFPLEYSSESTCILSDIETLYEQERDWTCAIACLRTILNSTHSEDYFIDKLQAKPGPIYSHDIKTLGIEGKYGCDERLTFNELIDLLKTHNIMFECLINYAHWVVIIGYFHFSNNHFDNYMVIYDPYYSELRIVHAEELLSMWYDGDGNVVNDFVAVKRK